MKAKNGSAGKQFAISIELTVGLEEIKKAAPPPPKRTLYRWLTKGYRLRRNLDETQRKELRRLAKKKGIVTGDLPFRVIIEETAGSHVSSKMKLKYASALESALAEKIKSKDLPDFIEKRGGINRLAAGGHPMSPKPKGRKSKKTKPFGLKPLSK